MLKSGSKVVIMDAEKIECNNGYFKNGDTTEIVAYRGHLALKHSARELEGGLVISRAEERYLTEICGDTETTISNNEE